MRALDLATLSYLDMVHPEDQEVTLEHLKRMQAGGDGLKLQNRVKCKNGGYLTVEWNAVADPKNGVSYAVARYARADGPRWQDGAGLGWAVGLSHFSVDLTVVSSGDAARSDISHLKQIMEDMEARKVAAEEATRTKSEFLAVMSHEVRDRQVGGDGPWLVL